MATRDEHIQWAAEAFVIGCEHTDELIATGRAEQAAREAGCRTDAQIAAWVKKWAPSQVRAA